MIKKIALVSVFLAFGFTLPAVAAIEGRVHYGLTSWDPDTYNTSWSSNLDLAEGTSMGADLIYSVFGGRVPLGLRYETMEEDLSGGGFTRTLEQTRISVIGGYRFILNTSGYLGILAGYAVSGDLELTEAGGGGGGPYTSDAVSGFTAGLDGAYRFRNGLTLGAEVGYGMVEFDETKNNGSPMTTYNGLDSTFELEGLYYKASIGFMF